MKNQNTDSPSKLLDSPTADEIPHLLNEYQSQLAHLFTSFVQTGNYPVYDPIYQKETLLLNQYDLIKNPQLRSSILKDPSLSTGAAQSIIKRLSQWHSLDRTERLALATTLDNRHLLISNQKDLDFANGSEEYGKFIDLTASWEIFQNFDPLLFPTKIDFCQYLDIFTGMSHPWQFPKSLTENIQSITFTGTEPPEPSVKKRFGNKTLSFARQFPRCFKDSAYLAWIDVAYKKMVSFIQNKKPLCNLELLLLDAEMNFEDQWHLGNVDGWVPHYVHPADLFLIDFYTKESGSSDSHNSSTKNNTMQSKMLLLSNQKSFLNHFGKLKNKLIKPNPGLNHQEILKQQQSNPIWTRIAKREALIQALLDHELVGTVVETIQNIRRKQAMTEIELVDEKQRLEEFAQRGFCAVETLNQEQETDAFEQNAKNNRIVYGEDGEPLDYWLYKLQGLHKWFECEICGGEKYRGPRAFHRHFNEWKHTYGLQVLGITNSVEFQHVSTVKEAKLLQLRLEEQKKNSGDWNPDQEEFEDEDGNVYKKKVYEDLKRQGFIK